MRGGVVVGRGSHNGARDRPTLGETRLPTLWVIVVATGVMVDVFTSVVRGRRRTVRPVPRTSVDQIAEALSRFSVMRRLTFTTMGLAVLVVVAVVWRQAIGAGEGLEIPVAMMAVELALLSWALLEDAIVSCAERGIVDPAAYTRQLNVAASPND